MGPEHCPSLRPKLGGFGRTGNIRHACVGRGVPEGAYLGRGIQRGYRRVRLLHCVVFFIAADEGDTILVQSAADGYILGAVLPHDAF